MSRAQGASAKPGFFAPALAFAAAHHDPDYRFHVVALANHWEAYYFPVDDFAITRGWYRQSDALHNELLNQHRFSAAQYVAWLHQMGVKYVFLPAAPLDLSGRQETAILTADPRFTAVYHGPQWTIFRAARGAAHRPGRDPAPASRASSPSTAARSRCASRPPAPTSSR